MFCIMSRIRAWNLLESVTSWTEGFGASSQRLPLAWALVLPDLPDMPDLPDLPDLPELMDLLALEVEEVSGK